MVIHEMTEQECRAMLATTNVARLACARNNQPYVVPIHIDLDADFLYSYATLGQKIEWMRANPAVCLEVLNINNACQTCHKWPEAELKARVETNQQRVFGLRSRAMDALVGLINDIKAARARGVPDAQLDQPRKLQRRAQFMLDFVEAENSTGFYAPQEAGRTLAEAIDFARQGQLVLRGATIPGVASR